MTGPTAAWPFLLAVLLIFAGLGLLAYLNDRKD